MYSKLLLRLQNERLLQTVMRRVSYKELKKNLCTCSNQGTMKHSKTLKYIISVVQCCHLIGINQNTLPHFFCSRYEIMSLLLFSFVVLALEALFGPDFDLVTSARFLPKTVLGICCNWSLHIYQALLIIISQLGPGYSKQDKWS